MVFTARHATGPGGHTALQADPAALGITHKNSRPYHPQTCGKVERFHQTMKKYLARQRPTATSIAELQAQVDVFVDYYNHRRPHRSCDRHTPAETYRPRPVADPTGTPPGIHWRLRTDRVDRDGKFTLRHAGRLHHIGIGRTLARTPVLMLIHDLEVRIIDAATGEVLRELVIDPNRDYQPTGNDRYARWRQPAQKPEKTDPSGFGLSGIS